MNDIDLNLTGLTEEELLHIKQVLSRDKKLQENTKLLQPTVNNNVRPATSTANDLVMAEIDRVHRMSPMSDRSEPFSTPCCSDKGSSNENIFLSFAGMINRRIEAMDFTRSDKKKNSSLSALAKSIIKFDTSDETPFNYVPHDATKKKLTLLELAATRRSNMPAKNLSNFDMNINIPHGKKRGSVLPAKGTQTLPRNHKTTIYDRKSDDVTNPFSSYTFHKSTTSLASSPSTYTPRASPVHADVSKQRKRFTRQVSTDSETSGSWSSPEKETFKENVKRIRKIQSNTLPPSTKFTVLGHTTAEMEHAIPETITELPENNILKFSESNDSGVHLRREFFANKQHNDSSFDADSDIVRNSDYDLDAESVYDVDSRGFSDYIDGASLYSEASSAFSSPIRNPGLMSQDSCDADVDSTSGIFYEHQTSVTSNKERSLSRNTLLKNLTTLERTNESKSTNRLSKGPENEMFLSPRSSPLNQRKSSSGASSPSGRSDVKKNPVDSNGTIGDLEISLVYYSAQSFKKKSMHKTEIPTNGTKSHSEKRCHVLSRREYTEVTNAKLQLTKETKSGATEEMDGELHLVVKGAKFQDGNSKLKAPSTYVKCYLLPDKYHNSKMKSEVIKKCRQPKWDHKFILAGFTQSELRERSLEIIVGSLHLGKQEVLGGAVLSVGQGGESQPWINSTKSETFVWKTALQISGNKVKSMIPLRAHMKPTYL